jgi:hypothetical protein
MTAQMPDQLINKHPRVNLRGLNLYGVIRGDVRSNSGWGKPYEFSRTPHARKDTPRCSANWRGYVAVFQLHAAGYLELVYYRYPLSLGKSKTETVCEKLSGDFWLVFKRNFFGPRTYIPFRNGRIVEEQTEWITEPPPNRGVVDPKEQKRDAKPKRRMVPGKQR